MPTIAGEDVRMKDDPIRKQLLSELRRLRRAPDALSIVQVSSSPTLIEVVGNGSVEQAHTTLLDVLEQQQHLKESDIVTFFATCGLGAAGSTLEQRLDDCAQRMFVDPRTVLRRSNRGADKLSYILRDMSILYRPLGKINLLQKGNELACQVIIRFPAHSQYRCPDVYIDGAKLEGLRWSVFEDPGDPEWSTATETLTGIPLEVRRDSDPGHAVWSIQIYWLMPVWASWATAMELSDSRLTTVLSVTRNYRAELALFFDPARP